VCACACFHLICLSYILAVGFTNGALAVMDALTMNELLKKPFHYARDAITSIAFSHDSVYFATAVSITKGLWTPLKCISYL